MKFSIKRIQHRDSRLRHSNNPFSVGDVVFVDNYQLINYIDYTIRQSYPNTRIYPINSLIPQTADGDRDMIMTEYQHNMKLETGYNAEVISLIVKTLMKILHEHTSITQIVSEVYVYFWNEKILSNRLFYKNITPIQQNKTLHLTNSKSQ